MVLSAGGRTLESNQGADQRLLFIVGRSHLINACHGHESPIPVGGLCTIGGLRVSFERRHRRTTPLVTIELASPWALNPRLGVVARRTGGQKARGDKIGRLAGKVAIFTGAGRGIRRPMARRFAAEGAARICL